MYANLIEKTGWTLEYISEVPCMEALKILGEAWQDEYLESQGKPARNGNASLNLGRGASYEPRAVDIDPVKMPNVWDGEKEGTKTNAESFMRMLANTR